MPNIFLFTGENAFALRQEKRRWVAQFTEKHGVENALQIDGSGVSLRALLDEVSASPFIASKRLVVVQGVPRLSKEEMQVLLPAVHPDCVLLFCDPAPDKRLGGLKHLLTVATVKEFAPIRGKILEEWMKRECAQRGATLEPAAFELLLQTVGENQDMLAQEIAKLALACAELSRSTAVPTINLSHVKMLAVPSGDQEVWHLTTLLTKSDLPGALQYAESLLRSGEDPYSLWNVLLWLTRCLGAVALCAAEGQRNPTKIASMAGVPFPTAKMLLPMAQNIPVSAMRGLISWAVESDRDLKTGGYRATADASQELVALIDELIVRCCGLRATRV